MHVGVGSGNPVKVAATEQALAGRGATVEAVPVESGVNEQPRGRAETVTGAENRARRALAAADYDLGVGIEGGVATPAGVDGRFLIMWAAATDGDRTGRGGGPAFRLPDDIADRVDDGAELGPVMNDVLDREGVAREGGAAAALTDGAVDREEALATAVAGALGPFRSELYGSR